MRLSTAVSTIVMSSGLLFGQARKVDDAALKNAAKSATDGDWLSYGLTPGETRYSPLKLIDAKTGKEKWRWDPEVNRKATADKMCCGVVNRGIAIYNGKIYVAVNDGRLQALDAMTGKPVWETRVAYSQYEQTLTVAPRIAKGKVIVGPAGADRPTRGFFAAY